METFYNKAVRVCESDMHYDRDDKSMASLRRRLMSVMILQDGWS